MVLRLPDTWSNWNLDMLVFEGRGKPEHLEKNLSEQGREPTTNSTHIWHQRRDLNPGYIGGRQVLSPLRHPCSPWYTVHADGMSVVSPTSLFAYNQVDSPARSKSFRQHSCSWGLYNNIIPYLKWSVILSISSALSLSFMDSK